MLPLTERAQLEEVLAESRRRGFLGPIDNETALAQSLGYLEAVSATPARLADLGTGGGLPGLVLAVALPATTVDLIERSRHRADWLTRVVRRLGLAPRVEVHCTDARGWAITHAGGYELVTARAFAPLPIVIELASDLLTRDGCLVVTRRTDSPLPKHLGDLALAAQWTAAGASFLSLRRIGGDQSS